MEISKYYNSYYENIGNEYNKLRLDSEKNMENVLRIIKKYANSTGAKILDIGCGTGVYGKMMKNNGFEVIGIDKSCSQIKQAELLIEAYEEDATNIHFKDNSFDICTMIIMIQQLSKEERIKAFKEVYRVLKQNGILIIKTCSHEDLQSRFAAKFFPKTLEIDKKRYPDIKELKEELVNFKDINTEKSSITIEKSKKEYIDRYKKRGTSNLSFLTDDEIKEGIMRFQEMYKNDDVIEKIVKNTFVIAKK